MFSFKRLSCNEKIARDVFRGKESAVAKLGNSPSDDMKPCLRSMFVQEYHHFNWDTWRHLPDSLVTAAFDDAYRTTPKGDTGSEELYGKRLKKNFLNMISCYEDGEFACW